MARPLSMLPTPRGRRSLAGTAAAAAVVLAAGCVPDGSPSDPDDPRGKVEQLKVALVEADADALVDLAQDRSSSASTELLTPEVTRLGILAGKDVEVEKTDADLNGSSYAFRIDGDDEDDPWLTPRVFTYAELVGAALPSVTILGDGVTAVVVDGERVDVDPVPSDGRTYFLPPGRYRIGVGGAERFVDYAPAQAFDTRSLGTSTDLTFRNRLTAAGASLVRREVDRFVDRCTRRLDGPRRPVACPVRRAYLGGLRSSSWTLSGPVRVSIDGDGSGWQIRTPEPPTGRMVGVARDGSRATDTAAFKVFGTVRVRGDRLVVRVHG